MYLLKLVVMRSLTQWEVVTFLDYLIYWVVRSLYTFCVHILIYIYVCYIKKTKISATEWKKYIYYTQ